MTTFEQLFPKPPYDVSWAEYDEWLLQLEGWQKCAEQFGKEYSIPKLTNEALELEGYLP